MAHVFCKQCEQLQQTPVTIRRKLEVRTCQTDFPELINNLAPVAPNQKHILHRVSQYKQMVFWIDLNTFILVCIDQCLMVFLH